MEAPMKKIVVIALTLLLASACSAAMQKEKNRPKESTDLRFVVSQFHMKMRWGQWEQASAYVEPEYRQRFMGRYEELGEDFKITDLEVKSVQVASAEQSDVEVEQQWYHEPNMTVQKERFIETWVMTEQGWRLKSRDTKEDWREKNKAPTTEPDAVDPPSETVVPPAE